MENRQDNDVEVQKKETVWNRKVFSLTLKKFLALALGGATLFGATIGYIQWDRWTDEKRIKKEKEIQDNRKFRVLVPLQASNKEYLDFMQLESGALYDEKVKDPFDSKVSQNIRDTVNAAVETWFSEPNGGNSKKLTKDRIDFYFFPEGYDIKSYNHALWKSLVEAKKANRNVIGLIGNVSSSSTLRYGELCGKDKLKASSDENVDTTDKQEVEAKIPMILPLATATSLTHNLRVLGVPSVLRLPPANDKQAAFISQVLLKSFKPAALNSIVVKDLSNKVYSEDLVEGFRENYVQHPLRDIEDLRSKLPGVIVEDNYGRILSIVPIGGEPGELAIPFIYPAFSSLHPDALVVFGMTNGALETLAQAKASRLNFKYIILTDGAVDEYLIPRLAGLVAPAQLKNIYLTFPLPCAMPLELRKVLEKTLGQSSKRDFEMTHALFVADATFTMLHLLEKALQVDNPDVKSFVSNAINGWKNAAKSVSGKAVEVSFPFSEREYKIDQFGNTTNLDYHLFRLNIYRTTTGISSVRWIHSELCPAEVHTQQQDEKIQCLEDPPINRSSNPSLRPRN